MWPFKKKQQDEEVKLCKDCKHCTVVLATIWCDRPTGRNRLSDGSPEVLCARAEDERNAWFFGCGKKAKYFEAKEETQ